MKFLLPFVAWPLIEIVLFVLAGQQIGVWGVLAWVLGTAVLGVVLLRVVAARAQIALRGGLRELRGSAISGAALTMIAGVLLILPGFLTDALGLALLLPPVQALVQSRFAQRHPAQRRDADVVEAEYEVLDREPRPSKWRDGSDG